MKRFTLLKRLKNNDDELEPLYKEGEILQWIIGNSLDTNKTFSTIEMVLLEAGFNIFDSGPLLGRVVSELFDVISENQNLTSGSTTVSENSILKALKIYCLLRQSYHVAIADTEATIHDVIRHSFLLTLEGWSGLSSGNKRLFYTFCK